MQTPKAKILVTFHPSRFAIKISTEAPKKDARGTFWQCFVVTV